jgi:hypothetical protein
VETIQIFEYYPRIFFFFEIEAKALPHLLIKKRVPSF